MLEGARNIAAFSHGSDVGCAVARRGVTRRGTRRGVKPQLTLAQNYAMKYCGIEAMMGYVHYRTVQCEFYIPLNRFRDSKHLTEIMSDVILGRRLPSTLQPFPAQHFSQR